MKTIIVLFLSLFLFSCGGEIELYDCDFITEHNICVKLNNFNINQSEIESITQLTIDKTIETFGHEKKIKNIYYEIPVMLTWIKELDKFMLENNSTAYNKTHLKWNCSKLEGSSIVMAYYPYHETFLECSALLHEILHLHRAVIEPKEMCSENYVSHPENWFGKEGLEYKIYNELNIACNILFS